ncbi:MAG: right-handed parallel beta-helix repeat-containing protein [Clostridia bacterium]|nr:right-handed parallel beta-helix repeat-containing protein [Clostridia bacterium]
MYPSSVFYVSPAHGSDHADGMNTPFKTLHRTMDAIRALRAEGDQRPFTVALTEDYYLEEPLLIDQPAVTLESCGGRKRIIGGFKIENWQEDIFNGVSCRSAKVGARVFTDLWVNGKRADATRYPREGELPALDTEQNFKKTSDNLLASSQWIIADLKEVEGVEDAIINYYHYWIDEHSPIESYDPETGKLVMKYASRFLINTEEGSTAKMNFYLTNVPSTFGTENEWYLERKTGKVYYCGEATEAYAPTLPRLLEIAAEDVRIRDLEFLCTQGDYLSQQPEDPRPYASDIQSVCWAPGAIIFENAGRCSIENCILHHLGIHGIEIRTGCESIRIENNLIEDLGAGGIKIFGGASEEAPALATAHCTIRGNEIAHCGKRYAAGCGILANHTSHLEIAENHIHHMDYTGISVGWVWGYAPSSTYGNIIRRNHIHHIGMGRLSDMGGIYLLGKQPGTVVSENRIHHVTSANYGGWGIYTDEGSSYITIENNVVFCTKDASFHQHYGSNNIVRNNIFAFGGHGIQISRREDHETVLAECNIILTQNAPAYHPKEGIHTLRSSKNLFWDLGGEVQMIDQPLEEWQQAGKDAGSIVADPLFENAAEFDFTLKESSPALKLGFKPLKGFLANGKGE